MILTILMIIYVSCVLSALGLAVLAAIGDLRGMTIPNYISVLVIVSFFIAYEAAYGAGISATIFGPLAMHVLAAAATLAITFLMFSLKMIGGGDSKLLTAFSFWTGYQGLALLLFYMALSGALLGVMALVLKKKKPFKNPKEGSWVARVQAGEAVLPYGMPIAIGVFASFFGMGFLAPENLSLFLVSK